MEEEILINQEEGQEGREEQSKPFYRGEFSLEDLRVINPIFNGIANEDIAFQYLTSNINEAE